LQSSFLVIAARGSAIVNSNTAKFECETNAKAELTIQFGFKLRAELIHY